MMLPSVSKGLQILRDHVPLLYKAQFIHRSTPHGEEPRGADPRTRCRPRRGSGLPAPNPDAQWPHVKASSARADAPGGLCDDVAAACGPVGPLRVQPI
jgi:hypothetical protein